MSECHSFADPAKRTATSASRHRCNYRRRAVLGDGARAYIILLSRSHTHTHVRARARELTGLCGRDHRRIPQHPAYGCRRRRNRNHLSSQSINDAASPATVSPSSACVCIYIYNIIYIRGRARVHIIYAMSRRCANRPAEYALQTT